MNLWYLVGGIAIGLVTIVAGPVGLGLGVVAAALSAIASPKGVRRRRAGLLLLGAGASASILLGRVLMVAATDPTVFPDPSTWPVFGLAVALAVLGAIAVTVPSRGHAD
jgi:hypothetical protein